MEEAKKVSRVNVEALLSVVSSKPTEPGKVHKFSLLDRSMSLHTLHAVFYYQSNPFNDGPMNSDLDNLRVSLSHVLDQYPVITGRLTQDPDGSGGWIVKCNDAGVRMLQARVSVGMDEWLRSADGVEERDLTVWEDMPLDPSYWSPFRIQINSFKCGGLAIGVSCTHMHADITSVTMFVKSWTEAHIGLPLTHPPKFNLPSPPPSFNKSTPSFFPSKDSNTTQSRMATLTFRFSSPSIQKLVSQVQNQCPKATLFDVLVAIFWSRIASFQGPTPNEKELSICVDMRNKGKPLVPLGYFGNALHFSSISQDHDKLLNGGLGAIAKHVHEHVAGIKGDDFWAAMGQLESLGKEGNEPHRMYGASLTCIDLEQMAGAEIPLMYTAMFKKGERPALVSYNVGNVEGEGLIIVMPSAEPGMGRNVLVTLPEEQIANLCKDQNILDLEPVVIMGGKK